MSEQEIAALVDKLKFSVSRVDPDTAARLFDRLRQEVRAFALAENEEDTFHKAWSYVRMSTYNSGGKSRGAFTVYSLEVVGMPAHMLYRWLPIWSLGYLRYYHVKGYHESLNTEAYLHLKSAATDAPMFRQITLFSPKQRRHDGGPVSKLPGLRIGDAKSDQQVVTYMAGGEPLGTETRLSGDKLKNLIGSVKDLLGDNPDDRSILLKGLAQIAIGEGQAYMNRLKEQCNLSDIVVAGRMMSYEELRAHWGWIDMRNKEEPIGRYTDKGFPLYPIHDNGAPVKGAVDSETGERVNFSDEIVESGEVE